MEINKPRGKKIESKNLMKFVIMSVLGILVFLFPIKDPNGSFYTLIIGYISDNFPNIFGSYAEAIVAAEMIIGAVGSIIVSLFMKNKIKEGTFVEGAFKTGPIGMAVRTIGAILYLMVLLDFGPEIILSENVGGALRGLILVCGLSMIPAICFMPLLTDYGLMEFIGTLMSKLTRPIFKLPGRASIDMLASWAGMVQVGLLVTEKQYVEGYYNKREASVVATCFTAVGVAFWIICGDTIGLSQYMPQYFLSVFVVGFGAAALMARIPPLSTIENKFYVENENNVDTIDNKSSDISLFSFALNYAVDKASSSKTLKDTAIETSKSITILVLTLPSMVMFAGTIGLILTETPIMGFIGIPFGWILGLFDVPEAGLAGTALMSGLADMFLPFIIGSGLASMKAKFIVGVVGICQIIYLSEVVSFYMVSKLPIKLGQSVVIFIEKTIICIPIAVLMANILGIPV